MAIGSARVSDFLARLGRRFLATTFGIAPSEDPDEDVRTLVWCWIEMTSDSVIAPDSVWFIGLAETETPESGLDVVVSVSTWNPTSRSKGRLST